MDRTCLIVDDEPAIRHFLKAVLQKEKFQALEAEDAPQAFRLIQRLNGQLDLIVTDIRMPGEMDGLDLAYAVRDAFPTLPVLLISGFADADARRPGHNFELIRKPFKAEAILTSVKRLVEPKR